MWNLKYNTKELIYQTETDTEIRIMVAKVERNDGGMDGSSELADANYYIQNR